MLSTYPGIQDYQMLRYQQLRYRFSDNDFLSLQWKAMQLAGWTYSCGKYKSPKATLVYDKANEIQAQLDECAVSPMFCKLRFDHELQNDSMATDSFDKDKDREFISDLRNSICYHMQLIVERTASENVEEDRVPISEFGVSDIVNAFPKPNFASTQASDSKDRTKDFFITSLENGSDLYNRKAGRKSASANLSERPSLRNALSSIPTDCKNIESLPIFPSIGKCTEIMSTFGVDLCDQIEASHEKYDFKAWQFLLSTNHSLLFYGNGSKYDLLSKFCEIELSQEGYCLQVDGFDADVSVDSIFDLLVAIFLGGKEPRRIDSEDLENHQHGFVIEALSPRDVGTNVLFDRAVIVGHALSKHCIETGFPIFLVIHSLDGFLSKDAEQEALALLVHSSIPFKNCDGFIDSDLQIDTPMVSTLRLVASVDSVDAPAALWSSMASFELSVIWHGVHTYRPYGRELAALNRKDSGEEKTLHRCQKRQTRFKEQSERVIQVLQNLAPRYCEVMQILAQLQLTKLRQASQAWVDYKDFRVACKSRFVVDKDSKLRTLQTELADHRLLVSKSEGPTEYVSIPYSEDKLLEILAFQRNADK